MDKQHLPYNILIILTVVALGLMLSFNLALRRSGFAVTVGYAVPAPVPPPSAVSSPASSPKPAEAPKQTPAQPNRQDEPEPEDDGVIYSVQFPLELNGATREQLMFIPRVGDVTSQRIVQYREYLGGYTSLEQLMDISGIGEGTYEQISAYLYLENEAQPQSDEPEDEELADEHYAEGD